MKPNREVGTFSVGRVVRRTTDPVSNELARQNAMPDRERHRRKVIAKRMLPLAILLSLGSALGADVFAADKTYARVTYANNSNSQFTLNDSGDAIPVLNFRTNTASVILGAAAMQDNTPGGSITIDIKTGTGDSTVATASGSTLQNIATIGDLQNTYNILNTSINNLTANQVHYVSVNGNGGTATTLNYNNDGATGNNSIVIGKGVSTTKANTILIGSDIVNNGSGAAESNVIIGSGIKTLNTLSQNSGLILIGSNTNFNQTAVSAGNSNVKDYVLIGNATYDYAGTTYSNVDNESTKQTNGLTLIGSNVYSSTGSAVAIGAAKIYARNSIAIASNTGYPAEVRADGGFAVGNNAKIDQKSDGAEAIGRQATIGYNSTGAVAIGAGSYVSGANSVAIGGAGKYGARAEAAGVGSLAFNGSEYGFPSSGNKLADGSVAIGTAAHADSSYSIALGYQAHTYPESATAIGMKATVNSGANNSIAFGNNSSIATNAQYSMAMGDTSAIKSAYSMAQGYQSLVDTNSQGSMVQGYQAKVYANSVGSTAFGYQAVVNTGSSNSMAVGYQANIGTSGGSGSDNALALGYMAKVLDGADYGTALGYNAIVNAGATKGLALGSQAVIDANASNAMAIGTQAEASKAGAMALGTSTQAKVYGSLALGTGSVADREGFYTTAQAATINGSGSSQVTGSDDAVAAPYSSVNLRGKTVGAVSVGSSNALRQIINVGDGTQDTDAVNLRQLKVAAQNIFNGDNTLVSIVRDATKSFSILGGAASTNLSDNNIGTVGNSTDGSLTIKDDNNSIIGSRNTIGYNSVHNFVAGADNYTAENTRYNFLAGSRNASGYDLTNATTVNSMIQTVYPNLIGSLTSDNEANLKLIQNFDLTSILPAGQTGMNLLAGSFNVAGLGAQNNVVQGSNDILRNNVIGSYILGSHVDASESHSVYMGDRSVATTSPLATTSGTFSGDISSLPQNSDTTNPVGLNDLITAGSTGQTSITINGRTYTFAGIGNNTSGRSATTNEVGVITVGRIVNEGTAENPSYKSYGRIIQNVAPGLVGANSTDAVNGSQLYAIYDAVNDSIARLVAGEEGPMVYTSTEGDRLYTWNNTKYDSSLVSGKFKQAANGQWYPVSAFDGTQLKSDFSGSSGFTLAEINSAKLNGQTLTVTGTNGATATSTAWADTETAIVANSDASLSLVNGGNSTTASVALYNVADAIALPAEGTTTQTQEQVAVSKLVAGTDLNDTDLTTQQLSQGTNLKDLQTVAKAGLDFVGDTAPADTTPDDNTDNDSATVHRNLSQKLTVTGGVTSLDELSSEDNIGVIGSNNTGSLTLRLAKDLTGLTSATFTNATTGDKSTISGDGFTFQGATPAATDENPSPTAPAPITITKTGINAGGTLISDVKSGFNGATSITSANSANAATMGDLQTVVNNAAWNIGQTTSTVTTSGTTNTYTNVGNVNTGERVSFDAGTGTTVTVSKTAATTGTNPVPETYNVSFAVKAAELARNSTSGVVTSSGDVAGYATAANVATIFNSINTQFTSATFGVTDSANTALTKNLNKTISIIGADSNITTAVTNGALAIKLNTQTVLGDNTAGTGSTNGALVVKNAGPTASTNAVALSNGGIIFRNDVMTTNTYADYGLNVVSGTKVPGDTTSNSPRLSFNGNQLATLKDGINFTGDVLATGSTGTNPFTTALGSGVSILGGNNVVANLTTNNIGVVSNGSNQLSILLAKDLKDMNSVTFGTNSSSYPYFSMTATSATKTYTPAGATDSVTYTGNVLQFKGATTNNADLPRISGIYSDTVTHTTGGGVSFAVKGNSDVVTVKELTDAITSSTDYNGAQIRNLFFGVSTTKDNTTSYASRNVYGSSTSTADATTYFVPIVGDSNINVAVTGTNVTSPTNTTGELSISLGKDLVLGNNTANNGGSITVNGDNGGESIKLDGSTHTLVIKAPQEGETPASEFTLDGRKGKLVFGGDESTATFIDFANTEIIDDLGGTELKRITIGTAQNSAAVATMADGLHFAGNYGGNIDRLLNSTMTIVGHADITGTGTNNAVTDTDVTNATTDKNTYVAVESYDTGNVEGTTHAAITDKRLVVRLAKDLTDLNTITLGGQTLADNTTASTVKLSTLAPVSVTSGTTTTSYSALKLGDANGGQVLLRNLAPGVANNDAVTVQQLRDTAWNIANGISNGGSNSGNAPVNADDTVNFVSGTGTTATVTKTTNAETLVDTFEVKYNVVKGNITSDDTTGVASTTNTGDTFATTSNVVEAINTAVAKSSHQYQGDNKVSSTSNDLVTVSRLPDEVLGIKGGATGALSDNNIGTVANAGDGTITVKLAKDLTGLNSASYDTTVSGATYRTIVSGTGISVAPVTTGNVQDSTKLVTLTSSGLNNGGNTATNIQSALSSYSTTDGTESSYGGLSSSYLSALRNLNSATAADVVKLNSAATLHDVQAVANTPIYFSADNYQDTTATTLARKLGQQLAIETGPFNMSKDTGTANDSTVAPYDPTSNDSYNDENIAAAVVNDSDGGKILIGFRNSPIFTNIRIGTITTDANGNPVEKSIAISNATGTAANSTPALQLGSTTNPVLVKNIATPVDTTDAANKAYVDASKATVTGTGAARITTSTNADTSTNYNVHVDKWLSYTDTSGNELTQAPDGKYYTTASLAGLKYDATNHVWTASDGSALASQPTAVTAAQAHLTVVGNSAPALSNVGRGLIVENSSEAINGSQFKDLSNILGLTINSDKTGFTGTFNPIDAGGSTLPPSSVVNAISQLTTAVNKGRVYAGDDYVPASGLGSTAAPEQNALTRELGERINFKGGADLTKLSDGNIGVVHSGTDTLLIKLSSELKGLTSSQYVDADGNILTITGTGLTVQRPTPSGGSAPQAISITSSGISAGGTKITNVAAGTLSQTSTDAVNGSQLYALQQQTATDVKIAKSEVTGTGGATVTSSIGSNGQTIYNVQVDQTTGFVDANGNKLTKYGDKYYKAEDIQGKTYINGNWYNNTDLDTNGQPKSDANPTAPPTTDIAGVSMLDGNGNPKSMTITNVKSALDNGEKLANVTDEKKLNSAANLGDVKNAISDAVSSINTDISNINQGINIKTNDGETQKVDFGGTVQVVDGVNTKVSGITTTVDENGKSTYTYHIDVNGMPMEYVDKDGNSLVKMGDNFYKASDVENGALKPNAQAAEPAGTRLVNMKDGKPAAISMGNVVSAIGGSVGDGTVGSGDSQNTFLNNLRKTDEATKVADDKVATVGDMRNLANSPFFAAGDVASDGNKNAFGRKLGETVNIVGGVTDTSKLSDNNIGVVSNGTDTLTVKLAKNLTGLESIKVGTVSDDGSTAVTTINDKGVSVTNGGHSKVALTPKGLDNGGNRITNVAPGIAPTDAATVAQLNMATNKAIKESNVGDSLGAALAALKPLQYDPLEPTQIMAGTGYYRGQTAFALGVAHYENESFMYNVGAAYGNSSHIMLNAGVTWKFGSSKREVAISSEYRGGPVSATYEMAGQMEALRAENQNLRDRMKAQEEKMQKQEELLQSALQAIDRLTKQQQSK